LAQPSATSRRISEFTGVAIFAGSLLWLVALVTYSAPDPSWFFNTASGPTANFAGPFGAFLANVSFQLLGYAAYLLPVVLGYIGWHFFWCHQIEAGYTKLVGAWLLCASVGGLLDLAFGSLSSAAFRPGGVIGSAFASLTSSFLNVTGAAIVLLTVVALSVILATHFSFGKAVAALAAFVRSRRGLLTRWREWQENRGREKARQLVIDKQTKKVGRDQASEIQAKAKESAENLRVARKKEDEAGLLAKPKATMIKRPQPVTPTLPLGDPEPKAPVERRKNGYALPPLTLLDTPKDPYKIDERELMDAARLLEAKCREFSVEGTVVHIHPGPVVTTYEFKPDAGVKYSRITGLAEDLCLAMQAESVIIDRIPGKATVGIQIPNAQREHIGLRELLESDGYARKDSKLVLALGKTIHGEPFISDLATMPHLLIAGSTGAGKSVSVNAMLSSILFRSTPDDVRFIMIDPKRLELGMYEEIPHLLTPVVVDPKQAANALRWATHEMEERYKLLAKFGVRNIDQFNRNVRGTLAEDKDAKAPDGSELKTLPYIIVIIDELADLMMVAGKEVEESIARLAQMARAVGIHLILATQRPSVDVITGLIKANLPARIAFRVASKIDSRTILDGNGAEQLLGKGDMLYLPPAASRFVRIHGPYISEQETARIASFLRKQGKPVYDVTVTAEEKSAADPSSSKFEKDDLYDEATRFVVSSGQASISALQRRLRIGFSRAGRLIDMMEMDGMVGPSTNGKRDVLVDASYFEEVDAQVR
jgi:S-DNA-T family DNA segregation ATPase FtsK/SpoIIIE